MLKTIQFERVDRGMFDSYDPVDIPNGAWAYARNFIPYNQKMNRRGGSTKFTLSTRAGLAPLVSAMPISDLQNASADLEWSLLTLTRTGEVELSNWAGDWQGLIPSGTISTVASDEMPWRIIVRNQRAYAVRRGGGKMRRIEADVWREAGRPAPIAAATLTSPVDGASTLPAGTYQVAYGYYDSTTGYYGNPGPVASVVVSAGDKITAADLAGKTTAYFADKIALWCSQVNGTTLFLARDDISCPSSPSTTSADILSVPTGDQAPTRNGQPESDITWFEEWNERFWFAKGSRVSYTPIGEFEAYDSTVGFDIEKGSGSDVVVLYAWGNKLVIGKRRKIFLFEGFDRSSWEKKPWSTKLGCTAPFSMRNCEGRLIFKAEDGFAMSEGGEEPQVISTDAIGEYLKLLDTSREELTYAEVWPRLSLYIAVFPKMDGTWGGVAYNWKKPAWGLFEIPAQPRALFLGYDSTGKTRLFAVMEDSDQIYAILEGPDDDGDPIQAELISGAPQLVEEAGHLASIHSISILSAATRWPITVSIYGDGNIETPIATTTISTEGDDSWKRIAIDNLGDPRLQLQVGIEYEGSDDFWISEWGWKVMPTKKHLEEF